MSDSEQYTLTQIVIDFLIAAVVGFPALSFHLNVEPTHRGFFCDDESIRYPTIPSTISTATLFLVAFFLPISVIFANEYFAFKKSRRKEYIEKSYILLNKSIPPYIWETYKQVGVFVFGICALIFVGNIGKYGVGRLRPNFLDLCKPNLTELCGDTADQHKYIDKYECLSGRTDDIREGRQSFPSGHAGISSYVMFYLIFYLQARMCMEGTKLVKPFIQLILVMMTWACSLSRIIDYKHHWSDVVVGFSTGFAFAIITIYYLSDVFKTTSSQKESPSIAPLSSTEVSNYKTMDNTETSFNKSH